MTQEELKAMATEFMEAYGESKVLMTADGQTFLPGHRHDAENHIRAEKVVPPVVFEFEAEVEDPSPKLQAPSPKLQATSSKPQDTSSKGKNQKGKAENPETKE